MELPKLTNNLTNFYKTNRKISNFSLAINKFGRFAGDKLEYMNESKNGLFHEYIHNEVMINNILDKQNKIFQDLESYQNTIITINMSQQWRMVIGLGNASVYNNGFTYHPVYGIPYIPGQNIKGVLRNTIIKENFNGSEQLAEKDPIFCHYLGCSDSSYDKTSRKGAITFLDAYPTGNFSILPDIINSHYREYYQENNSTNPHDAQTPFPIIFLTTKSAEFKITMYLKNSNNIIMNEFRFQNKNPIIKDIYKSYPKANPLFNKNIKIDSFIIEKTKEVLGTIGVGAKTSLGYGRLI